MFSYLFMIVQTREDVFVSFISIENDSAGTALFLKAIMFCSALSLFIHSLILLGLL